MDNQDIIWKETFFQDDFNVDQCLSKYTLKSDLETLRRELLNYGNEFQQQMSEILKRETDAIVNLAEYLTNLNSKIEALSIPIHQLREEIKTLYELIKEAKSSYKSILENLKLNNSNINDLNLKLGIISSTFYIDNMLHSSVGDSFENIEVLERIVNKYSVQKSHLDELDILSPETENVITDVENRIVNMVNKKFLEGIKNDDEESITKVLRMYCNLGKENEAHKTYQVNIVRPALQPLFTERYLKQCNNDIGLIYKQILSFLENDMNILYRILEKNAELKSYNFTLKSLWVEFDKTSRENFPFMTAPGNPELFQRRFTLTWKLLVKISEKSGTPDVITKDLTFQDHIKRFNLPVYFEIRYQQIAGNFEKDMLTCTNDDIYAGKNDMGFKLKISTFLLNALKQCFQNDVFIDHLADQFLKLSLLLISRYLKWFDSIFENKSIEENLLINIFIDLNLIKNYVCIDSNELVYNIISDMLQGIVQKVFKVNSNVINSVINKLENHLVNMKIKDSLKHLQQVGSIPRLYRRTNRMAPKEASQYMKQAISPITLFHKKVNNSLIEHQLSVIIDKIITEITSQYLLLVQEVLRSVCKTEESLRRLKSRNVNANEDTSQSDTISDEMKIREQIKFDIKYFLEHLYNLGLVNARSAMDTLKSEIK